MGNHKVLKTAGTGTLRYSMYDFIHAIKDNCIIWDRYHEDFHNRELRDQAWQKIGQQLCKNFDTSTAAEKQEISKTLLKRWKNTRDSYLRVNRLRQSGDEISRASYIYEKELAFLLDVKNEPHTDDQKLPLKRKRLCTLRLPSKRLNSENQGIQEVQSALNEGLRSVLEDLNYSEDNSSVTEAADKTSSPIAKGEVATFATEFNASTPNVPNSSNANTSSVSTDPDQSFFESIKPHMQRMSADQKLDFQIEVLKILRNFKPSSN